MATFDKTTAEGGIHAQPAHPLAAAIILLGIMLDRFIFYGARGMMTLFVVEELGRETYQTFLGGSFSILVIVGSLAMGMMADFFLEHRILVTVGAFVNAIGLVLIATGNLAALIVGTSMIIVGSSSTKMGNITYLGYLFSNKRGKIEGGYSLSWTVINIGAFCGALGIGLLRVRFGYAPCFLILGALGLLQALTMLICTATSVLPDVASIIGGPKRSALQQVAGLAVMVVLIIGIVLFMVLKGNAFWLSLENIPLHITIILGMVIAFVVYATKSGMNVAKRNGIMAICILLMVLGWAGVDVAHSMLYRVFPNERLIEAESIEAIVVTLACTVIALVLLLRASSDRASFQGVGLRIALGIVFAVGASSLFLLSPGTEGLVLLPGMAIAALGESLWASLTYATVWRITPDGRKGTSLGMLMGAAGMSNILAGYFQYWTIDIGGKLEMLSATIGVISLSAMAILVAVGLWAMLSNYRLSGTPDRGNPFE